MTGLLQVEHVSLRFGGIVALNDISFGMATGELLAIVGPNGTGKTSLLNCITGAYHATEGSVMFEGNDITNQPAYKAAKRDMTRTFQHNELFPHLTTLENLLLGRHSLLGYSLFGAALYLGRAWWWDLSNASASRR